MSAPLGNGTLILSMRTSSRIGYALFAAYAIYVLVAVFAQTNGTKLPFVLGDVGEFCLFFAATVFFLAGLLFVSFAGFFAAAFFRGFLTFGSSSFSISSFFSPNISSHFACMDSTPAPFNALFMLQRDLPIRG